MIRLVGVEARRYLARRLVRLLVLLALLVISLVALAVYASSEPLPDGAGAFADTDDVRYLITLWPQGSETQGLLMFPAIFVPLVAFIAGASMVGAEWRAGTVTTQLTWEPRRILLLTAKLLAAGLLAALIAAALTILFASAFLPTILTMGSTAGADGDWWSNVLDGWIRISALAGITAVLGGSFAAIGRNSAGAIGVGLAWISFGEGLVRVLWPSWRRWLVGENYAGFLTGGTATFDFSVSTTTAGLTLIAYTAGVAILALVLFAVRDVTEPA